MAREPDAPKALTKNPLGAAGTCVAENVERLRQSQNLTFAALASKLAEIDRPIPTLGLRKIVAKTRRVDADDLVALAVVLGVSPISLLMPADVKVGDQVPVANHDVAAGWLWSWFRADRPLPSNESAGDFYTRALPPWHAAKIRQQWEESAQRVSDELAGLDGDN